MLAVGATTKYFSKLFFIGYCSRRIMGASLYLGGNILNPAGEGGGGGTLDWNDRRIFLGLKFSIP